MQIQGAGTAVQMAASIEIEKHKGRKGAQKLDDFNVGRGAGTLENLWEFN